MLVTVFLENQRVDQWSRGVQRGVAIIGTIMFVLTTAHLGIDISRAFKGFTSQNPEVSFGQLSDGTWYAKVALWMVQTCLYDGVLIWRCWVVYNRSWWSVSPMLLGAFLYIVGASLVAYYFNDARSMQSMYDDWHQPWMIVHFSVTLYINVLCTAALAWRVLRYSRRSVGANTVPAIVAVIDTAVVYTATYTALLVTFVVRSNAHYSLMDAIMPLAGVTFTLLIIQIRFRHIVGSRRWSLITSNATTFNNAEVYVPAHVPIHGPSDGRDGGGNADTVDDTGATTTDGAPTPSKSDAATTNAITARSDLANTVNVTYSPEPDAAYTLGIPHTSDVTHISERADTADITNFSNDTGPSSSICDIIHLAFMGGQVL
ncbi:hypothetical protein K488DRAFT_71034 [Vararia minispora EC-137]|uniref:Uncharacterized protein n=1 Tax=Vararia minispora EC-137 TaxID=1314806 RepID=A0ACB8QJ80_9AGAM|nr:hypothetical protein K488DRAFT_71034 [Vararia minispora EC-137]